MLSSAHNFASPDAMSSTVLDHPLVERFRAFVRDSEFPCVGAKAALAKGGMRIVMARDMRSAWDDLSILSAVHVLVEEYRRDNAPFQSLAVIFAETPDLDEAEFERLLWQRAQSLSAKDVWLGQRHDPRVSDDPSNPHFSLSFGGEGFFVVGLHAAASRPARRFAAPVMVFNLHDQFEQLRASGRFEKLQDAILARDIALAGSVNPMLANHGTVSPARQYSGRQVDAAWQCPFARSKPGQWRDGAPTASNDASA